jgi:hypothetical protein
VLSQAKLQAVIARANLAPSVHNAQPARWRPGATQIRIAADLSVGLNVGDPTQRDAGLSCGAAVEATVLALSAHGVSAQVRDHWSENDLTTIPGHRMAATLALQDQGVLDGLHSQLEERFTWRGAFSTQSPSLFGWSRTDAVLVLDGPSCDWLAQMNDTVSLDVMRDPEFRRELLSWMRLRPTHKRYARDGLSRAAMQMSTCEAFAARFALGPLFRTLDRLGLAKSIVAEAELTRTAPVIAAFHRSVEESPVTSGRAYMRHWLEATQLGMAGWPMAALSDDRNSNAKICAKYGIGPDRRLIQVLRFGTAGAEMPGRARRTIEEVLV